ncbi:MAG: hypothetical protein JXR13_02485 [Thalassovita sp.]
MVSQTEQFSFDKSGFRTRLNALATRCLSGLNTYMDHQSRRGAIETMQAKSDDELAAMGVRRDDIVRYVFRDVIFL